MTFGIVLVAACLAYANGANDNFKGVATLFGSGTTDYAKALRWGTVTTFLGSLAALILAEKLLKAFSGRGLIDSHLVADPTFVAAVALGAGSTVLLATRLGMPVSTTHGLVGAIVGAGWSAGSTINTQKLLYDFFGPMLLSPFLAIGIACVCYPIFRAICGCWAASRVTDSDAVRMDDPAVQTRPTFGLDAMHYLTAGAVSFARGLNDTPKIAALLMVSPMLPKSAGIGMVAVMMALGGIISARRVAVVMSKRITPLDHLQGFTANSITAVIVIAASYLGLPVSTTHVSCGALFGIGMISGEARLKTILTILTAWLLTLPTAACLAVLFRMAFQ